MFTVSGLQIPGGWGIHTPPPQYLTSIPPIILILPIAQHAPIFFSDGFNGKDFGGRNMQGGGNFLGIKEFEQEMGKKGWRAKKKRHQKMWWE